MKPNKEGIIQISTVVDNYKGVVVYGLSNYGKTYKLNNGEWQLAAAELE